MNSYLTPHNIALSVVYLRNSRAITRDIRHDGNIVSRNLLRPELISASLASVAYGFGQLNFTPLYLKFHVPLQEIGCILWLRGL